LKNVRIKAKRWEYPKGSGKWKQSYQVLAPCPKTGKEIARGTFKTKKEAERKKLEVMKGLLDLTDVGKMETRTVADLVTAFLADCKSRESWTIDHNAWHDPGKSMAPSTLGAYENDAKHINRKLGDVVLITLDLEDLQTMVGEIEAKGQPGTAWRAGSTLKTALRWGAKRGWTIKPMLLSLLDQLRLPPKRKREHMGSEEHFRAIFKVIYGPRRHKLTRMGYFQRRFLWVALLSNGPRRGEVSQIRIENIDWVSGRVDIKHSFCDHSKIEKPTKSKAGMRVIWLPKQALDAARQILDMRGNPTEGLLLVPRCGGKSISSNMRNVHLVPTMKEAGISKEEWLGVINFHSTRHRSNSEHAGRGVSKPARQALLGHSRSGSDTHDDYTHMLPENMESRRVAQELTDYYMPAEIVPTEEIMQANVSGTEDAYLDADKASRAVIYREKKRQYQRQRRAVKRTRGGQVLLSP
jgi:integrase